MRGLLGRAGGDLDPMRGLLGRAGADLDLLRGLLGRAGADLDPMRGLLGESKGRSRPDERTTRESRGRSRPAESCFVLMCSLMMLIECVMKIRVCKTVAFFFCWGNEGVHAPGGILVDFCSIQGTGTTQLYWRVPIIDMGSSTWCR